MDFLPSGSRLAGKQLLVWVEGGEGGGGKEGKED
jgi:hypothetical protein